MAEDGDGGAERLLNLTEDFGDTYIKVEARSVPESERYPEEVKYSMQYGTTDGDTIIRYDNFPNHPGVDRHHKHLSDDPDNVENVDYTGLEPLYNASSKR